MDDSNTPKIEPCAEVVDARNRPFLWIDKEILSEYLPNIGASALCVYLGLLYFENGKTHQCWPSAATLSKLLGLSVNTVRTSLKQLKMSGLISIQQRTKTELQFASCLFTILDLSANFGGGSAKFEEGGGANFGAGVVQNLEPNKTKKNNTKELIAYSDSFMKFWKEYPTGSRGKAGKGKAFQAWQRLRCDSILDKVLNSLASWKKTDQWQKDGGEFIPDPQTWLNRHGWEDELPVYRKQATPPRIPRNPLEMTEAEKKVYAHFENMQNPKRPEA